MNLLRRGSLKLDGTPEQNGEDCLFCSQARFRHLLRIERLRTERSRKPFLLLLTDISSLAEDPGFHQTVNLARSIITSTLRETDISGWYDENRIIGSLLTEVTSIERSAIEEIYSKIHIKLEGKLGSHRMNRVSLSFHLYPEQREDASQSETFDPSLYADLLNRKPSTMLSLALKRILDTTVSAFGLLMAAPLFLAIAAAIKLTSEGPIFFRQDRLGLNGRTFTFLKFRSMYRGSDSANHQEYIERYIGQGESAGEEPGVFKLTDDPRITPVGAWLRKTSLDEIPQLINVLKGDMSLVGPRPPIRYEYALYDTWHRRRLLAIKPGITGLWQVTGRSRTTFDDMVRLDLRYIHDWSLWLDLKILLKTPEAVFSGDGAY